MACLDFLQLTICEWVQEMGNLKPILLNYFVERIFSSFQSTLMDIFTEFNKYFYDFITVTTEGHARADDPGIAIMRTQNLQIFDF